MESGEDLKESRKGGMPYGAVLLWAAMAIILYVLSFGPVLRLIEKTGVSPKTEDFMMKIYVPVIWAYRMTPLHKPIGLYLHFWSKHFDSSGALR